MTQKLHLVFWEDQPIHLSHEEYIELRKLAMDDPGGVQANEKARGYWEREMKKPCKGRNTNICVGEGCYNEACVREVKA